MHIRKNSITDFHPQHLTEEEIKNPYLVIEELFDKEDLPGIRDLLWKWLKTAATGNYNKEPEETERENIFFAYDLMKKLLEAVHLIYLNQMQGAHYQSEESTTEDFEEFKMLPERLPATRA